MVPNICCIFVSDLVVSSIGGSCCIRQINPRQECFTGKIYTKLHQRPEWRIFHILTGEDIADVISCFCTVVFANSQFVYIITIKLQGGLTIWILFSRVKKYFSHSMLSFIKYCSDVITRKQKLYLRVAVKNPLYS